jgi:hypothetical protein
MKHYLQENPPTAMDDYLTTWTKEPTVGKPPDLFLDKATPPLFYVGDKPTPSIKVANSRLSMHCIPINPM